MGCPRRDQYGRDMGRSLILVALWLATALIGARYTFAGQAPAPACDPDVPISHRDRVYSAEQYSNTVSVTDPVDNKLLRAIHLGDPLPANHGPARSRGVRHHND